MKLVEWCDIGHHHILPFGIFFLLKKHDNFYINAKLHTPKKEFMFASALTFSSHDNKAHCNVGISLFITIVLHIKSTSL